MSPLVGRSSRWASRFQKLRQNYYFPLPLCFSTTTTTTDNADNESKPTRPSSAPPVRVGFTESAGRGVFATRRIEAGELIHTAEPTLSHPSFSSLNKVCYFCLRKLSNSVPSPLKPDVSFCSQRCYMQSEGFHKVEMKANLSTFDEYCCAQGLKYPLLVKRLAFLVLSGVVSADHLDVLQPAGLSSQMISMVEEEHSLLRSSFQVADIASEKLAFLSKQWYAGVLARIRINAFRVELAGGSYEDLLSSAAACVNAEAAVGNAVYILPSFYNHDCDPNAHILWLENANAQVKALREIEEGEELRICYIDASMDYEARQAILVGGFGFKCTCLRCSSQD